MNCQKKKKNGLFPKMNGEPNWTFSKYETICYKNPNLKLTPLVYTTGGDSKHIIISFNVNLKDYQSIYNEKIL